MQRLLQETDRVRGQKVIAERLLAIDSLRKVTMKKGVLHIKLMSELVPQCTNAKHNTDGGRLHHRAKSLIVVDSVLLGAVNYPTNLVASKRSILVEFVHNPLAHHNVGTKCHC